MGKDADRYLRPCRGLIAIRKAFTEDSPVGFEREIGTFKESSEFQAEGKAGSAKRCCTNI